MASENPYPSQNTETGTRSRVVVWKMLLGLAGVFVGTRLMAVGLGTAIPPLKAYATVIWLSILASFLTLIAVLVIIENRRTRRRANDE